MAQSDLQNYIVTTVKTFESGDLAGYADPADPAGIGTALTQVEIDFLKRIVNEIKNRFPAA